MNFAGRDDSTKIQLSLASIMFFSPLVKHLIYKGHLELAADEKSFIEGYVRFGYVIILLLLIAMVTGIATYFFASSILQWIYTISLICLIAFIVFGIFGVFANISIFRGDGKWFSYQTIQNDRGNILFSYVPLYNIFFWYKLHKFDQPYRWVKESILLWTFFVLIGLFTQNIVLSSFVVSIIIIRVSSLMSGIDLLDNEVKKRINTLFLENPEEIRAYVTGFLQYLYYRLQGLVSKKTILQYVGVQKEKYNALYDIHDKSIWLEYGLFIACLIWQTSSLVQITSIRMYYLPIVLVVGRYLIMIIKRKHLPNIPLFKEISDGCMYLYDTFSPKLIFVSKRFISKIKKTNIAGKSAKQK